MSNNSTVLISELRSELERLMPAVELVDQITAYSTIVKQQRDAIEEMAKAVLEAAGVRDELLKEQYQQKLIELTELHKELIKDLNAHSRKVVENINTIAPTAIGKMADFSIEAVQRTENKAAEAMQSLANALDEYARGVASVCKNHLDNIAQRVTELIQSSEALNAKIAHLVGYLEEADLPNRLDTLNGEVKLVQSKLEFIETITNRLETSIADVDAKLEGITLNVRSVEQNLEAFQRKQELTMQQIGEFLVAMRNGQNSVGTWTIIIASLQLILIIVLLLTNIGS